MTWSCSWMEGDGIGDAGLGWGQAHGCERTIGLSPPCSPGCHRPGAAGSRWWWPGTWGCSCWAGAPSSAARLPGALPSWHPPGRAAGCAVWWWHRTRPTPQGSWDGGRGFTWVRFQVNVGHLLQESSAGNSSLLKFHCPLSPVSFLWTEHAAPLLSPLRPWLLLLWTPSSVLSIPVPTELVPWTPVPE